MSKKLNMDFACIQKTRHLCAQLEAFKHVDICPNDPSFDDFTDDPVKFWKRWPQTDKLQLKAKSPRPWTLFLLHEYDEFSPEMTP